ncbi:hypothetical protein KAZ57_00765 [Patescibacteria group bacterium]|nr:hypothetical protein [Patescibacteria group bacterium]
MNSSSIVDNVIFSRIIGWLVINLIITPIGGLVAITKMLLSTQSRGKKAISILTFVPGFFISLVIWALVVYVGMLLVQAVII